LATLRERQDRELRLWTLCRGIDRDGSGCVKVCDVLGVAERENLRGLSRSSVSRIVQAGAGCFWSVYDRDGERWLQLRGLSRVCLALGVTRISRTVDVALPLSLKHWRALCLFSQFSGRKSPMGRAVLADLADREVKTIYRHGKALGGLLEVQRNAVSTGVEWVRGDAVPEGHTVGFVNGRVEVLRVLPNSYKLNVDRGKRGMTRKVNWKLSFTKQRETQQLLYPHHSGNDREAVKARQRTRRALGRRLQEQRDGVLFVETRNQARGHIHLWQHLVVANGKVYGAAVQKCPTLAKPNCRESGPLLGQSCEGCYEP
jgi:hypothetical protein